jgi:hypothetical protein
MPNANTGRLSGLGAVSCDQQGACSAVGSKVLAGGRTIAERGAQSCELTSPASTTVGEGSFFSFTVSASGAPTPRLKETGTLPHGVKFHDNHNGTATLSGTSTNYLGHPVAGSYSLTITGTFGSQVVQQVFTLDVT